MTKAQRQRLINSVLFFAQRTQNAGTVKLFKLIYLLDFEHFRQTGRSVTGLEYQAWKMGPVSAEFRREWKTGFAEDLAGLVNVVPEKVFDHTRYTVIPRDGAVFDESHFTPRQLGILTELVSRYGDTYAPKMIDVTHAQNGAWDRVWRGGEGHNQPIPYELAVPEDSEDRDEVLQAAREASAFRTAFA